MDNSIYDKLKSLIQLDIDAVSAYEQAIEQIDDPAVRSRLEVFRDDHQRHIDEFSNYLTSIRQEPPKQTPDFKGYVIEGFTSMRSITGTNGALKAMKSNEKLTNKKYQEAEDWLLDPQAKEIVARGLKDEHMHMAYIEEQLTVHAV